MKLQLDDSVVSILAATSGPATDSIATDVSRVLSTMAERGLDPVTRKDVTAVLVAMGAEAQVPSYAANPDKPLWWHFGCVLNELQKAGRLKKTGQRGYYTQGDLVRKPNVSDSEVPEVEAKEAEPAMVRDTLTRRWMVQQIKDYALDRKVAALLKRKFPYESYEVLLSETRLWFVKWANAGTCDEYIAAGKPPTLTILTIWVEGKQIHRIYREGQDALQRHNKGARTQAETRRRTDLEVNDYILAEALESDPNAPKAIWTGDADSQEGLQREYVDTADPLAEMFEAEELGLARDIIRVRRKRAAERYARMFDHMIEGRSKEETAVLEGCSELRVTHLFQRVRDDLREAPVLVEVALKVLRMIDEEPFTTQQEIEVDLLNPPVPSLSTPTRKDLKQALQLLVMRGFAQEAQGASFMATDAGRTALEMESLV